MLIGIFYVQISNCLPPYNIFSPFEGNFLNQLSWSWNISYYSLVMINDCSHNMKKNKVVIGRIFYVRNKVISFKHSIIKYIELHVKKIIFPSI